MAFSQCKGTQFQIDAGGVLAEVAQVISLDLPEGESETFDADTLDNEDAGIIHMPTGRTEFGSVSGELFYDPATHSGLTSLLTDPPTPDDLNAGAIILADTANTTWTFDVAGFTFGATAALSDGLKGSFSAKVSGDITYA